MLRVRHLPVSIREAGLGWIELELRMIQDQTPGPGGVGAWGEPTCNSTGELQ